MIFFFTIFFYEDWFQKSYQFVLLIKPTDSEIATTISSVLTTTISNVARTTISNVAHEQNGTSKSP